MNDNHIIFGLRAVMEALQAGRDIDKILVKKDRQGSELLRELHDMLRGRLIPVQHVPVERLNRITRKNHQGVIAFASAVTYQRLEDIVPFVYEQGRDPLLMLLDGVTDVRNFGAIARTAYAAGVDAILVPSKGSALINGDAMKTSAGALSAINVCRADNLKEALDFLKDSGLRLVGVTEKANDRLWNADLTGPLCVVMGSEEDGISPAYQSRLDQQLLIPMPGDIDSLNVSVATGIVCFEVVRQRGR